MSHALTRLRKLLDDPLLVRTPQGMVPTNRGAALAGPVQAALALITDAITPKAGFNPASAELRLTIATTDYVEIVILPELIRRLQSAAPGIAIRSRNLGGRLPQAELESGRVDLAIAALKTVPDGFYRKRLFDERFLCAVRSGHPATRRTPTLAEFAAMPHAMISPRGDLHGAVDDALAKSGLKRRVAVGTAHFIAPLLVVAETDLVVTAPERMVRRFAPGLGLELFEPPLPIEGFVISQVWHERTHADPACKWLRALLAQLCRELEI